MADIEAKLRVIIDDRMEKLVLPSGIPSTLEELQTVVKETFDISDEFSLQYFDSEFEDYFTIHKSDEIKHKDTVKVVYAEHITLNLVLLDECTDNSFLQHSTDTESTASNVDSSAGQSSSQHTIILSNRSATELCQPWPKQYPVPQFAFETEMILERATEDFKKNGTPLTNARVKSDILETLAKIIYTYTAYPSSAQISDVAEALVKKYPFLKEPGSFSGYYGWQQSIKSKMANYRTKLRGYSVPEQERTRKVKNQEQERIQLLSEGMKRDNYKLIKDKMAKTFAHRRNKIINQSPSIEDIKARWPALFEASHIQDEFQRITMVQLDSKFMSKLDEHTPRLLKLFHSKGGSMGLQLQAILLMAPSNPSIDMSRGLVIWCLMVYLGESTDQLLKEYDDPDEDNVSQDLVAARMTIYRAKNNATEDIGIVAESGLIAEHNVPPHVEVPVQVGLTVKGSHGRLLAAVLLPQNKEHIAAGTVEDYES
ncbi:hypothetical protein KUCAC02_020280 [Chaenocephalus aceratus]|uniref:Uncharacterized protein n=1 Tax=Chaenocephalus aceratus TaxID=36190 RepID=A0ACB9VR99_CHAAC|nr:hypothetical protein KUCAC02_020280 [Chaenocephalus aceratus]